MTTNPATPPPFVPDNQPKMSYGKKIFMLGLICCTLMFGVLAVWIMSEDREFSSRNVAREIVDKWGKNVYIQGPVVKESLDSTAFLRPQSFDCDASVETISLHRGIYEAEVFNAHVIMSGTFNRDSLLQFGETVFVKIDVKTKQIDKLSALTIGGEKVEWSKAKDYLYTKVNIAGLPENIDYSAEFDVKGSAAISIKKIANQSSITIGGDATNPSFDGDDLPGDRDVNDMLFYATWNNDVPTGIDMDDDLGFAEAKFLVGVDRYQKVIRSMKYSFILIFLTFLAVLFVEIMKKRPIPLLNYFLIGVAIILFYFLLLSFVELIPFAFSYLLAAAMTILLISGYIWKMLNSRSMGLTICGSLTVMYGFCYIMLSINTYALLIGSLILFIALAAMMYGSLKLKQ